LFLKKWKTNSEADLDKGVKEGILSALAYIDKNFFRTKAGWYEGFAIGLPSHSNTIESSHKYMKAFENIKERTPCIKFIKGTGLRMLEEWSKERAPEFLTENFGNTTNTNVKEFAMKPMIITLDWTNAAKWNAKNNNFVQMGFQSNVYLTCDKEKLTRIECLLHLSYIENITKENDFDTLIYKTNHIHTVLLNETEWESSICSCFWWHKNLKCSHTISLACRMKLANFDQVAYSIPLNKKRKAGRPPAYTHCLLRDKTVVEDYCGVDFDIEHLEAEHNIEPLMEDEPLLKTKPRGRPKKSKTILAVIDNVNTAQLDNNSAQLDNNSTRLDNNSTELENRYPKRTRN
jgi:hypothetical protein